MDLFKSVPKSNDWITKNIETMMGQIAQDARHQRPLPLRIAMQGLALQKFIEILKSKNAFFPSPDGSFSFLTIPVKANNRLPYGSFVVERFKDVAKI